MVRLEQLKRPWWVGTAHAHETDPHEEPKGLQPRRLSQPTPGYIMTSGGLQSAAPGFAQEFIDAAKLPEQLELRKIMVLRLAARRHLRLRHLRLRLRVHALA